MALIARTLVFATGAVAALATSQAPEFTQQYRQRLGGALQELRVIVADFDADARRADLTREQALAAYGKSADGFLRDRGMSVARTVRRFESLQDQAERFESWPAIALPAALIGESDAQLVRGAWQDFRPGIPVTPAGAVWAAFGFLFGIVLAHGGRVAGRSAVGATRRRGLPSTRQGAAAYAGERFDNAPEVMPEIDGPNVDSGRRSRR